MKSRVTTESFQVVQDADRFHIDRFHITASDGFDEPHRQTLQVSCSGADAVPAAVVEFIAQLHDSPYQNDTEREILQRVAGAMGLTYQGQPEA